MRIQLPVETWIEILDWLRRRDLIKKLEQLWDREFTPIVQDWLHKYTRNVKIGHLLANSDGLSVRLCKKSRHWEKVPFADVELPENVSSFEWITIKYLDFPILTLLRQMRPLFHKISLVVDGDGSLYRIAFHRLIPIIGSDSIESLVLDCDFLQFLSTNYPAELSNVKLIQICDSYESDASNHRFVDWLFTKRDDGQPRMLLFPGWEHSDLCEKIQERFLNPARRQCAACPFFVRISVSLERLPTNIPGIKNVRTDEQLTFKTLENNAEDHFGLEINSGLLITNCPINTNGEWLEKRTAEMLEWNVNNEHQAIMLQSLEISPLFVENANNQQSNE